MKIQLKMIGPCQAKLGAVKALKEFTGFGLKEAKDFIDSMCHDFDRQGSSIRPIHLRGSNFENQIKIHSFRNDIGSGFVVLDQEHERHMKLMSLGLANESDLATGISELLGFACYNKSIDDIESELAEVFTGLNKEDLERIYNQLLKKFRTGNDEDTSGQETISTW
jgi:hypothetical protein